MEGLVDYGSSSSSSSDNAHVSTLERKKLKLSPQYTPHEESEVSSSVVQEDHKESSDHSIQNPATVLMEMGCTFEQIWHAISLCGQETQVEELFDFIQAKYYLEEEGSAPEVPAHIKNAQMEESKEPCPSTLVHIPESHGYEEKGKLAVEIHGHTGEASCSRSHHVEEQSLSTLQKLDLMGFTQAQVQKASEKCNSIDFDDLLEYLLDNKEVEPRMDDFALHEVDAFENEDCEDATMSKLKNMGFTYNAIKKALAMCGSHNFEELLDVLNACSAWENLKDEKEVDAVKQSMPQVTIVNSFENEDCEAATVSKLQNMGFSYSAIKKALAMCGSHYFEELLDVLNACDAWENLKVERDVDAIKEPTQCVTIEENTGAGFFNNRISYAAEGRLRDNPGATKWTGSMEKLWSSYMGGKKKTDSSPPSDSDDTELEILEPAWEEKARSSKRKLEFKECKEVKVPQLGRMMGFGIPGLFIGRQKPLPLLMRGPPYFYFENVANVPNNEWDTIKRHFNGVDPEFTDSKFFSASRRPRGYVHNFPLEGRALLSCVPPMTIAEAFPDTQQYVPDWDTREKLNCINTRKAPDSLCRLIRTLFALFEGGDLPYHRQQEVVQVCRKWNLVWVGPGQAAPLEPHEIELLLGFDRDHTRGCSSMTDRYDALGNSFQVHTVAYHLSPLKSLYPNGVTVLSLFSGIGGAEVALHKIGIHLKVVIAVEINEKVRGVLASWWRKSGQRGVLKLKNDVRDLTYDVLAELVDEVGPIDLIIGGSPCNNLSGNNRVSRVGLSGSESSLFFEFPRILNIVTQVMRDRGFL